MKGLFITFEGGECSGKTTIIEELKSTLENKGYEVLVTREPGGSFIAEQIRKVLLDKENVGMSSECEALLYAASRIEHLKKTILPALEKGTIVISDRYLDSSLVYQGYARDLGVDNVLKLNMYALNYMPDLTIFIDVKPEVALKRLSLRQGKVDRLDSESFSFHQMVYDAYLEIAKMYKERIKVVDGNKSLEEVTKNAINLVLERLL